MKKSKHDHLVQTTVSAELFKWVTRAAQDEGISVAAFMRRLVIVAHAKKKGRT